MAENIDPEELRSAFDTLAKAGLGVGRELNDLEKAAAKTKKEQEAMTARIKETAKYFGDLGSTVTSANKGTGKYAEAVTGAANAAGDAAANLLKSFGLVGIAAGGLIKVLGGLAAASLKQNEALIKTYKTLSDFGAIDTTGIEGLNKKLLGIGLTAESAENLTQVLRTVAPEMAMFGGTVAAGSAKLVDINRTLLQTSGYENALANLGYTSEDILKYSASFIASNTKNQTLLDRSTGSIANKSFEYMKTLTELTMLTGASRDQAEEAAKAQQVELGWRLHLAEVAARGPEGEREAQRLQQSMQMQLLTNRAMGMTVMEQIVNQGGIVTQAAAMNANILGNTWKRTVTAARSNGDITEMTANILRDNLPLIDRHIQQFGSTGKISAEAAKELALDVDLLNTRAKLLGMKPEDIAEMRKQVEQMTTAGDSRINQDTARIKAERGLRGAQQDLIFQIGEVAVPVVTKFAQGLNYMGAGLAKYTKVLTNGKVDFTDMFKEFGNMADVAETLNEEQRKQADLAKERTDLETKLNIALKYKAEQEKSGSPLAGINARSAQKDIEEYSRMLAANRAAMSKSKTAEGSAQSAATAMGAVGKTEMGTGSLEGLRLKEGANAPGAEVSPSLVSLAQKLQAAIPDIPQITSMNDKYHQDAVDKQGRPINSKHKAGRALDFTLPPSMTANWNEEQSRQLQQQLRGLGASYVLDEYLHPSPNSTGGHIHAEVGAMTGGQFKGPKTGYPVTLHGNETVFNEKQMASLNNAITKFPIGGGTGTGTAGSDISSLEKRLDTLAEKFDLLINYTYRSFLVQEDMLVHQKV